ncbi:glycosyltransferase [Methylosinus sp. Ce-a6]|uniref:glycosyltransferase n=1 Tax=Methylosinus sp. Ce-a6 TaxID=2172005 RepID=UPI001FCF25C4|nr:glycosyltransferase [Methylosinus sp. Ce-a6]
MDEARVFQFHSGSAVGDAVTNSMFYMQELLEEYSIPSRIFVEHRDPRLADRLSLIGEFRPRPDDVLIIHHSMGHDILPMLTHLNCRKILHYHNVTPPSFFESGSFIRRYAAKGLQMLDEFRDHVLGASADSNFNAAELRSRGYANPVTIPALRDYAPLRTQPFDPEPHYYETPRYQLLFVGRINPNKGQLHLVEFMERYADAFEYPLHLTLVGRLNEAEPYAQQLLAAVQRAKLQDRITITGHVSEAGLLGHYRAADAYVSMSEHEGFGVPLLEAMAFDVPVIAYDTSAIGDTMGGAGVLLKSTRPAELAERLDWLFSDRRNRRHVLRGQRRRLMDFDRASVAARLVDFLAPFLSDSVKPARREALAAAERKRRDESATASRQYVIEGPCETSYSLAITNRKLAIGLDRRSDCAASLVPMEGVPGYQLREDGVRANPEIIPLLQRATFNPEATVVSFRNMYPMRPAGMMGDFSLCGISWEESEISLQLARLINRYCDGVAAPTEFVRRVYRNSGIRVPMSLYGHGIDHLADAPASPKRSDRPFTFLHVSSGLARKGIEDLIIAYCAAFTRQDNVQLVIKTYRNVTNVVEHWYDMLIKDRPEAPVVKIVFDDLDQHAMCRLYQSSDAVVLPTRGEGFGYPAAEAMFFGVPLIVTGYSGQMDFCAENNAYLLDYDFELTGSHLGVTEAMWARVRIDDLAQKMLHMYNGTRKAEIANKLSNASKRATEMTWDSTSQKIDDFVKELEQRKSINRKLRIGWVSTWNTKCGIARYSDFLISNLPEDRFDIKIFANYLKGSRPDEANVVRNWTHRGEPLDEVVAAALAESCDIVVFQYNYGFHTLAELADAVERLDSADIETHIFFHKTKPTEIDGDTESIANVAAQLKKATRLVVHSVEDVNRLKEFGLVDNVVKLPHGAIRPVRVDHMSIRQLLGFGQRHPIIGCYGFVTPLKGLHQLILAFAMIARKQPHALLMLINAVNDDEPSQVESERCRVLVEQLGLSDRVVMFPEYLDDQESFLLMQACDVIVFPYQESGESSSAAVRHGISTLRPILATPLPIFENVASMIERCEDTSPAAIAIGVEKLLGDSARQAELRAEQSKWLELHDWRVVGERFANMMIGLYQDRHNVSVERVSRPLLARVDDAAPEFEEWMMDLPDRAFVQLAYQRVLGRDPDEADFGASIHALGAGQVTREELVASLYDSVEREQASVNPTSDERKSAWSFSELDSGDDQEFVERVYQRLLGRAADEVGLANALGYLQAGGTRRHIAESILGSDEFMTRNKAIMIVFDSLPAEEDASR